ERVREEGRVLRLLGELAMEGGSAGELERQGVPGEPGRVSLAQDGRGRDRLLLNGREHGPLPGLLELLELNGRRVRNAYLLRAGVALGARTSQSAPSGMAFSGMPPLLQPFEAIRRPLAGKIRRRPRHFDERELERQTGVGALAHVLDRYGKEITQPEHGRFAELVRLLVQPFP